MIASSTPLSSHPGIFSQSISPSPYRRLQTSLVRHPCHSAASAAFVDQTVDHGKFSPTGEIRNPCTYSASSTINAITRPTAMSDMMNDSYDFPFVLSHACDGCHTPVPVAGPNQFLRLMVYPFLSSSPGPATLPYCTRPPPPPTLFTFRVYLRREPSTLNMSRNINLSASHVSTSGYFQPLLTSLSFHSAA